MDPSPTTPSVATNGTSDVVPEIKGCSIKVLPRELWESAAAHAAKHNPANAPMVQMVAGNALKPMSHPHLSLLTAKYWGAAGISLTVSFLDEPEEALRVRILSHMNAWGQYANVKFTETASGGRVRIARFTAAPDDGFWSYLGTDIDSIAPDQPTMNLDNFSMDTPDSEFFRVVRHETGHTLGFPHEHMRADFIEGIDYEKAIAYFMRTQGWSREEVIQQVLDPIAMSTLNHTAEPDQQSIMCYPLPASIMKNRRAVPGGRDINAEDGEFAGLLYPKSLIAGQATSS